MRIRLLGPIEAVIDGEPAQLGGRQRRTLLAILAVHAGETVSTDRLVDELWGEQPPDSARKTVQSHIARLRRALNVENEVLASSGPGYALLVEDEAVDIRRFERLVADAGELRRTNPSAGLVRLDEALELFRGSALAGLADDAWSLRVEASRIEEMRLAALEQRLELLIAAGRMGEASAEAERLLAEHPLRERLWALLMQALYASGRQGEALQAFSRARQTLVEELGIDPSAELRELEQRILNQDPDLAEVATGVPSAPPAVPQVARNPYKGLRPFDEADSADFFGREDLVRRLSERVEERGGPPMVVLAGPSGAGKSSVVRAGLIPLLRDRGHEVTVMFPGRSPVAALAKSIAEVTGGSASHLEDDLLSGRPIPFEGILIVDQFEELFTMAGSRDEADSFLDVVMGASWRSVVTVRADFLDHMLSHPATGGFLEEALVLVPPLQPHEIEAVVVGPARRAGLDVAGDLVQRVTTDVQERSSALPLLQFALTDTFERRAGGTLTVADYERAGGLTGALARRADQVFESLDAAQREAARELLLSLVAVTDEGEWVRRRVTRRNLSRLSVEPGAVDKVIERLGSLRLLTFDQDPETGEPTVEVAHEALIGEWPLLAGWVDEAHDDLRMRRRLVSASREWEGSGRDPDFLLSGARLTEMEAWRETAGIGLDDSERRLLAESRRAEDVAARQRAVRRRVFGAVLVVAALVAGVLAVVAFLQADEARQAARVATVRELSAASAANLGTDPELGLLLALRAVEESGGEALPEAEESLHAAVQAHRTLMTRPSTGAIFFGPDGERFVAGGDPDVPIWEVDTGDDVLTLSGHTDRVFNAVWSPDGSMIATNGHDGTTRVWDAGSGDQLWVADVGGPISIAFSPDSALVATSYGLFDEVGAPVRLWEARSGDLLAELPHQGALGVNFGPDGLLGVADPGQGLTLWDTSSHERIATLDAFGSDVVFTPDGGALATVAGPDVVVFDLESMEERHRLTGSALEIGGLDVSPDGTLLAAGDIDGGIHVWSLDSGDLTMTLRGHRGGVFNLAFGGPQLLGSSGEDDTARVWDLSLSGGSEALVFEAFGNDIEYAPDGSRVAAASFGAGIWDANTGAPLTAYDGHGELVLGIEFSPEGDRVVTTALDGTARVWDPNSGAEIEVLDHGEPVGAASFDPAGATLATAGFLDVYLWDADTWGLVSTFTAAEPPERRDRPGVFDVEFGLDGAILATSGGEGAIKLWDVESQALIWEVEGHAGSLSPGSRQVEFSPEGDLLASAGFDGVLGIWDVATGAEVRAFEAAGGELWAVDFSPDGSRVATGGSDGRVVLWGVHDGTRVQVAQVPGLVAGVEFSPDGRHLAVSSDQEVVRVLMLEVDDLTELARSRLTRWWTPAECLTFLHAATCPEPPPHLDD